MLCGQVHVAGYILPLLENPENQAAVLTSQICEKVFRLANYDGRKKARPEC